MGRKKIKIERIAASKNRQVTFNKRKVGLMKKAMELSILCDCVIGVIIMADGKLYTYSSSHMDEVMALYQRYDGPYEGLNNTDVSDRQRRNHSLAEWIPHMLYRVSLCSLFSLRLCVLRVTVGCPPPRQGELLSCRHSQAQAEWRVERRGGRRLDG